MTADNKNRRGGTIRHHLFYIRACARYYSASGAMSL